MFGTSPRPALARVLPKWKDRNIERYWHLYQEPLIKSEQSLVLGSCVGSVWTNGPGQRGAACKHKAWLRSVMEDSSRPYRAEGVCRRHTVGSLMMQTVQSKDDCWGVSWTVYRTSKEPVGRTWQQLEVRLQVVPNLYWPALACRVRRGLD